MEYISDRVLEPDDFYEVYAWNELSTKSQNTLHRAIERSDVWRTSDLAGFSFDLLSKISIEDLHDARFIGPARAEELIQELADFFLSLRTRKDLDPRVNISSKIINSSSRNVLEKLTVEPDLNIYLRRIEAHELLSVYERDGLLQELIPEKNAFKRIVLRKRDQDIPLSLLIDANLRLSFALAKRVCLDRDIRARTIAGNLGLLKGITTFSDLPKIEFERHIMKFIREFIEELVGTLQLSYEAIHELMLGSTENLPHSLEDDDAFKTQESFADCENFSQLLKELDRALLKLPKVDERALSMLKHRHQAFGEPGSTLDELGKEWGVTRERVRQIVDPLMEVRIPLINEVLILEKAVELFEKCESEDHFSSMVAETEIFAGIDFSWERLWGLTRILAPNTLANRVFEKHLALESKENTNSSIRVSIKKDRSKFGLYDLRVLSRKYEITEDKAFKMISDLYPRSIRSGSLVLARTKNLDTMFENSIAKQLKVISPLEISVLKQGLERTGKNRDTVLLGTASEIENLIVTLAGIEPSYEKMAPGLVKEIEFQNLEKWLIGVFSESSLGILHTNDVVNFALRDGNVNVSSVTVYLLNSPIIRSHGRSLYSLVGTVVSVESLNSYAQIIRSTSEASELAYEMTNASSGILTVKPNLNVITSGIIFPPSGYKKIFQGFEFKSYCECGGLDTIQAVKFAPSGFWTGFTAMIRHGFSHHAMTKSSSFRFEFNFDDSRVKLLLP